MTQLEPESRESVARRRITMARRTAIDIGVAALFAASILLQQRLLAPGAPPALQWLAALLPIVVLTVWFWRIAQNMISLAEFERSLEIRAAAITGGLVIWLVSVWGLLNVSIGAPSLPLPIVAPAAAVAFSIARAILASDYQ